MTTNPKVSVVIPTFKRPELLTRAIGSVKAQTFSDWELVVSDDENPSGSTWSYLKRQASIDHRIKISRNPGPHGQSGNMNNALSLATGQWIKPLYDDDLLHPTCLEILTRAVKDHDSVVLLRCLANQYFEDRLMKRRVIGKQPRLELIPQRFAHLAMYLTDVEIGIPSQVMVRRSCILNGAFFEDFPALQTLCDAWWYHNILKQGDLLLLNEPLVGQHQGEHKTITRNVRAEEMDQQNEYLRGPFYEMVDPALDPPPVEVVKKMMRLMSAIHRVKSGKLLEAARLVFCSFNFQAAFLAARWALRRSFPGHFRAVPRFVIEE